MHKIHSHSNTHYFHTNPFMPSSHNYKAHRHYLIISLFLEGPRFEITTPFIDLKNPEIVILNSKTLNVIYCLKSFYRMTHRSGSLEYLIKSHCIYVNLDISSTLRDYKRKTVVKINQRPFWVLVNSFQPTLLPIASWVAEKCLSPGGFCCLLKPPFWPPDPK